MEIVEHAINTFMGAVAAHPIYALLALVGVAALSICIGNRISRGD